MVSRTFWTLARFSGGTSSIDVPNPSEHAPTRTDDWIIVRIYHQVSKHGGLMNQRFNEKGARIRETDRCGSEKSIIEPKSGTYCAAHKSPYATKQEGAGQTEKCSNKDPCPVVSLCDHSIRRVLPSGYDEFCRGA